MAQAVPNGNTVTALARQPDHIDLFVVGNNGGIYSTWWDGVWHDWCRIGPEAATVPNGNTVTALARQPDHIDLFVVGNNGGIYSTWWDGVWHDWFRIQHRLLPFNMQPQQQTNWCWAATSTSVDHYYDPGSGWTQCGVADGELGRTDCCGAGAAGPCNVYGTLDTSLQRVGNFDH